MSCSTMPNNLVQQGAIARFEVWTRGIGQTHFGVFAHVGNIISAIMRTGAKIRHAQFSGLIVGYGKMSVE